MKTWITYLTALLMGLATALLLGDSPAVSPVLSVLSKISIDIGILLFIPMLFITFSSGIASLRKDRLTCKAAGNTILWSIVTAVILPVIAAILIRLFPVPFPVSSSAGMAPFADGFPLAVISGAASSMLTGNFFYVLASTTSFLLPVIVLAWIFGLALKPNADVIKPAYVTMNSLSEVFYRIARTYTVFGSLLVYCTSSSFFTRIYQEKTVFVSFSFTGVFVIITFALGLVVLPLIYLAFTRGKRNPYRDIIYSLAPMIAGLTSGSAVFAAPMIESTARHNLGVQKRVSSTAVPVLIIIGKAGSAAIATLSVISLIYVVTGSVPSLGVCLIVALASAAASYVSSAAAGFESVFITLCVLKMTGITLYGGEMTLIGLLPLLSGLGTAIDTEIALLGAGCAGVSLETDINPIYKDIV